MMKKGIIFDLDGTLWDSCEQVIPAWNRVLKRYKELNCQVNHSDMKGFMGKTLEEIAAILLPDIPVMKAADILSECCREELIYLNEHGGTLYPKLEETLGELRKNFNLYIVSNCQDGYIDTFLDYHKLWKYFDDIECSGRTSKSKGENIKLIIQRNNLVKSVYIGDTQGDLNAADFAGIPFLYATYGFGKINRKEITVNSFADIPELIKQVI